MNTVLRASLGHLFPALRPTAIVAVTLGLASPAAIAANDMDGMHHDMEVMHHGMGMSKVTSAVAVLSPTAGNDVHGVVHFTQESDGVHVVANVEGLTPGKHGFHIHAFGDISAPDGTSTGGHFNPTHEQHGAPTAEHRHAGDLGNITADASGHGTMDYVDHTIMLNGPMSIVGHGVIVHAGEDDLHSQPTGAAGKRVAQGVIGVGKS